MRGELTPAPDQRVRMLLRSNSLKPSDRELVRHLREADAGAAETLVDTYGPQVVSARGAHHRQRGGRGRGRAEQPRSLVRMLKARCRTRSPSPAMNRLMGSPRQGAIRVAAGSGENCSERIGR
jgi:hypothetical protein